MKRVRFCRFLCGILIIGLFPLLGCAAKTYRIEYVGGKDAFFDAKDACRAGKTVTLKTGAAMDEMQEVLLDGEKLQTVDGGEDGFFCYEFVMPAHDVTIEFRSKNISAVEPVLLVDYYEKETSEPTAPGKEDSYYELVLYDDDSTDLLLEAHADGGTDRETVTRYRVPRETENQVLAIVREYRMMFWDEIDDPVSVDGMLYVCRFRDDDYYERATSEQMPENGMEAFLALRGLLTAFLNDEYRES